MVTRIISTRLLCRHIWAKNSRETQCGHQTNWIYAAPNGLWANTSSQGHTSSRLGYGYRRLGKLVTRSLSRSLQAVTCLEVVQSMFVLLIKDNGAQHYNAYNNVSHSIWTEKMERETSPDSYLPALLVLPHCVPVWCDCWKHVEKGGRLAEGETCWAMT